MSAREKRRPSVMQDFKASKDRGRFGACCEVCRWRPPVGLRERIGTGLLHGHHVVPIACGGSDHPDNLILVCPTDHAIAHRLGEMVRLSADDALVWWGPQSRRELLVCFAVLKRPDDYERLAAMAHDVRRFLDDLYEEALPMNNPRRGFTLERGTALNLVGRRIESAAQPHRHSVVLP